jgi:hypothetical protein
MGIESPMAFFSQKVILSILKYKGIYFIVKAVSIIFQIHYKS